MTIAAIADATELAPGGVEPLLELRGWLQQHGGADTSSSDYQESVLGGTVIAALLSCRVPVGKLRLGGPNTSLAPAVPRFITTAQGVTIDRAAISRLVSLQKQGRHVLSAREYNGGSYVKSVEDAQRVLDDFHSGAAQVLGMKGNDIVVRTPNVTGINVNPGAGYPRQPTSVFFIKGTRSPSVVPYNPNWTP
ncbi:MAG: hypothetical protein LCI03_15955 [Actinobacteria bacterium]|nr:hypothetical protein [Actinomycetota bacterium]